MINVGQIIRIPDFNPRSREGSDSGAEANTVADVDFNPRSREGSDSMRRHWQMG